MQKSSNKKKSRGFLIFLVLIFVGFIISSLIFLKQTSQYKSVDDLQPQKENAVYHKTLKKDRPDLFAKYMTEIKTRIGENKPDYSPNYRINELLKATNMKSTIELSKFSKTLGTLNWTERGPGNVSGRTRAIVVDPDDATYNTWFVGSVSGGVWKTTDKGASWLNLTSTLPNLATSVLMMAQSNHNIMYLGTGEGFGNIDQLMGSGIWKSTDKGDSWNQLTSTANLDFQNVTRLVIDPNNPNIVVVSTSAGFRNASVNSGIWKTIDGGVSWNKTYNSDNSIEDLVANPENFNTLYASVNGSGIIKSTDTGNTWFNSSSGITGVGRMEIAIAPTDTNKIYGSAEGKDGGVLYVSDDAGAMWFPSFDQTGNKDWLGGQGWYDNAIVVDPYVDTTIYVAGVNIFKLDIKHGVSATEPQITGVNQINTTSFLAFVNWGGAYAGGGLDIGENFLGATNVTLSDYSTVEIRFGTGIRQKACRFTTPGGPGQPSSAYTYKDYVDIPFEVWDTDNSRQLMVSFRDEDNSGTWNLYGSGSSRDREYVVISSVTYDPATPNLNIAKNGGVTYKNIYDFWPELPSGAIFDPKKLPSSKIVIKWGIITQRNIQTNVITDAYNEFGSSSKGVHPDHHNLTVVKTIPALKNFRLIDGNDGGVTYSDDKGLIFWSTLNGYNTTQFYGVDKMPGQNKYVGGIQDNGSYVSPTDPNASSKWIHAPSGDGFEAAWNYGDGNQVLESSQFNSIYKSTTGGTSWSSNKLSGFPTGSGKAPFITKIESSKLSPNLVFVVGGTNGGTDINGVSRSTDFGDTWEAIKISAAGWSNTSSSTKIKISLADPSIVWAGRALVSGFVMSVSQDSGKTFTALPAVTNSPSAFLSGFATNPVDKNTAYALFSLANTTKIMRTTDLGQTWTDISGFGSNSVSSNGFPDVAVFSLLVMPNFPNIIWAGTEIGIFESIDDGATWHYANNGLPNVAAWEMKAFDNQIIVATHGRGIWTTPFLVTAIKSYNNSLPTHFTLEQNYPNPFNPTTKIQYSLANSAKVTLNVYDILGNLVQTLVSKEQSAGNYEVNYNGTNLASGLYIYRLQAQNTESQATPFFEKSKKMLLIK